MTWPGAERYRARLGGLVRSSPLPIAAGVVVGIVDAKGKTIWTRKVGAVFSSAALAGGRVLCGSDDGFLHALDAATGAVVWSARMGAKVRASPAVGAEAAIVGAFDGRVAAVRIADGT
ncbi:MAG: pyrrolo-quinoline quinone, partial [Acidobacteria bacterium]